jgi:hypothetical protein
MDMNIPLHLPHETQNQIDKANKDATDSDARFVASLLDGFKWQLYTLNAIQAYGHWGCIHPLHVRPDYQSRGSFSDSYDILIGSHPDAVRTWTYDIDVKARTRAFDDPKSFPFPTIIIEPLSRHKSRRGDLPDFYAHVSQYTGSIIFVPTSGQSEWDIEKKRGREYVTAPVSQFLSLEDFVSALPEPLVQAPKSNNPTGED